jgi:CubicO group peptidase (beta-lactamase class C family)
MKYRIVARIIALPFLAGLGPHVVQVHAAQGGRVNLHMHRSAVRQNRAQFQAFIDRMVEAKMRSFHVPGFGISVVQNGSVLLDRGYGYADLNKRIRVSPTRTIWRMASIAVPFTAAAVMQLVEQRRLALHTNVNRYLRQLSVPASYQQPITLAELMTHTAGFDDPADFDETLDPSSIQPFCRYLRQNLPSRAMPPGQISSRSDWDTTLAGCVVEDAAGIPFERYVERHVFRPLGMRHSTFIQPPPLALARDQAIGYDGDLTTVNRPAAPDAYNLTVPAAGLRSSVNDVTQFMLAQLHGGESNGHRVLQTASVSAMQRLEFTNYRGLGAHPPPAGFGYGFDWIRWNDLTVLTASGGVRGFNSLMTLVPSRHFGFFMVTNTGDAPWIFDLQHQILDHFLPSPPAHQPAPPRALRSSLDQFTGTYRDNAYARHTIEKLGQLGQDVQITSDGNSRLTVHWPDGSDLQITRVAPLLFETVFQGTPVYFGFRKDGKNQTMHFLNGTEVFDRIAWYETSQFQQGLLAACTVIFLTGFLQWVLLPLLRRRRTGSANHAFGFGATRLRWTLVALLSTVNVSVIGVMYLVLQTSQATNDQQYGPLTYTVPWYLYPLLALFLIAAVLSIGAAVIGILTWRDMRWSPLRGAHYWLVTLTGIAFIPFLLYWNLLGFNV